MRQPLLIAVDEDREALETLEAQLVQRYARDYRVECLADPDEAVRTLTELAEGGEEVALVLAATAFSPGSGSRPARAGAAASPARQARAVGSAGRLDGSADRRRDPRLDGPWAHRLLRAQAGGCPRRGLPRSRFEFPARVGEGSPPRSADRSHRRRDVVGSGLRAEGASSSAARSRIPSSWRNPTRGASCSPRQGTDAKLPLMVLPDGRVLSDPSNAEIAEAAGAPAEFEEHAFDVVIVGRGAGRACRRPSTAPPRGCASSWWTRAASVDRPGRAP